MKLKNEIIIILMTIALIMILNINVFAKTVVVNTDTLKLRSKPSTDEDSKTIMLLDLGQKLEYIDEEDGFYKIKLNGTTGYVSKDYTKIVDDEKEEAEIVEKIEETEKTEETQNVEETETIETIGATEETTEAVSTEMKTKTNSKVYILPLINANVVEEIQTGINVRIISKVNGWAYVETENVFGWIRISNLEDISVVSDDIEENNNEKENENDNKKEETIQESEDIKITTKIMYVNNSSIYVRKGPGTDYEIIDSLILNNSVKVIAENGDWYKVELDSKEGYIAKRLLSDKQTETTSRSEVEREIEQKEENALTQTTNSSSKGQQLVDFAKQYLGKKYVYGGSGPETFDCSGFTMYVYKNFGINLSHSAIAQSKVGTAVSKANLQPGDLVFFTDYETGVGIGHVGIYIGNGDFIHASSGTGYCVKISTLLSGSYYNRYETARRLF